MPHVLQRLSALCELEEGLMGMLLMAMLRESKKNVTMQHLKYENKIIHVTG